MEIKSLSLCSEFLKIELAETKDESENRTTGSINKVDAGIDQEVDPGKLTKSSTPMATTTAISPPEPEESDSISEKDSISEEELSAIAERLEERSAARSANLDDTQKRNRFSILNLVRGFFADLNLIWQNLPADPEDKFSTRLNQLVAETLTPPQTREKFLRLRQVLAKCKRFETERLRSHIERLREESKSYTTAQQSLVAYEIDCLQTDLEITKERAIQIAVAKVTRSRSRSASVDAETAKTTETAETEKVIEQAA